MDFPKYLHTFYHNYIANNTTLTYTLCQMIWLFIDTHFTHATTILLRITWNSNLSLSELCDSRATANLPVANKREEFIDSLYVFLSFCINIKQLRSNNTICRVFWVFSILLILVILMIRNLWLNNIRLIELFSHSLQVSWISVRSVWWIAFKK